MKTLGKRILIVSTGVVLAISLSACGHRAFHASPEERAEHLVEYVSDDLDLDETQIASLNALKAKLLDLRKAMQQGQADSRDALLEIVSQPTLDRDRAVALIQGRLQTLQDQTPQIVAAIGDFYDGLNAEQQQELRNKMERRMKGHHHGFGFGH